jgi:actin-related protein
MFDPSRVGHEFEGMHELVNSALKKTDIDLRKHLYKEIILTGGNTAITGLPERLLNELTALVPRDVAVRLLLTHKTFKKACPFLLILKRLKFSLHLIVAMHAGWEEALFPT